MVKRHTHATLFALLRRNRRPPHFLGKTDRIPLMRRQELSLFREIFNCWREIDGLRGERAILRVDLRVARRK